MKVSQMRLVILFVLVVLTVETSPSQDSFASKTTLNNVSQVFIPQPQLGYVVKSSSNKSAKTLLESSLQGVQNVDVKYLNVANRPEITVVLGEKPLAQSQNAMSSMYSQSDTEYIAPVYTLNGETVAIIPEIIVRLVHESDFDKLENLCRELNCTILRNLLYTKLEYLISLKAQNAEEVLSTIELFSSGDFVEWAWPNIAFQPKLCGQPIINEPDRIEPNDTYFNKQWHLDAIRAPEAWAYTTGDPNIIIAILDEGVDINHPDLINNIWTNPNEQPGDGNGDGAPGLAGIDDDGDGLIDEDSNGLQPGDPNYTNDLINDDDENGFADDIHGWDFVNNSNNIIASSHGTACAGLIAAKGNNGAGLTGVTWNCTIMPITIIPFSGFSTWTEPMDGFRYASAQGADILSNSWAVGDINRPNLHSVIKDVTQLSGVGRNGKGCVVLFASGNLNGGGQVMYPAKYREVIAVGAIDQNDFLWDYSCYGSELDIVAPSGDVDLKGNLWSTDISGSEGYNNRDPNILDYTDKMGGTSGSCPIAAGVAALVLSIDPNLTSSAVRSILIDSSKDLGSSGWDNYYGFGSVDAFSAVTLTLNQPPEYIFVDDDALYDPGPYDPNISDPLEDGSEDHPFDSIQEAVDYSLYGNTIVVFPGIYTGQGNRDIRYWGKAIAIRSQEGREGCIIDCETKGPGFHFDYGEGTNSVLDGVTIRNSKGTGGGIWIEDSSPTIRNCVFSGNSSNYGGVIYNSHSSPTISNCIFEKNEATHGSGGGMYNFESNPTVNYCTFIDNNSAEYGGAIYNYYSNPTINNCTFIGNSASSGGGIFNNYDSHTIVIDSNFINNSSFSDGGGICNLSGMFFNNCIFSGNNASEYGGGLNNESVSNLINCKFNGNSAKEEGGGISNFDVMTLNHCILTGNSAGEGGGISNYDVMTLNNCILTENSAGEGGGMVNIESRSEMTYCMLTGNSAGDGGGIFNFDSKLNISRCIFAGNKAFYEGGGIYNDDSIYKRGIFIDNSTFTENRADELGACVYNSGINEKLTFSNCIVWGNDGLEEFGEAIVSYSNIEGSWPGNGNISIDPLFVYPGYWDMNATPDNPDDDFWVKGDYHLKSQAGRWDTISETWVQDDVTSPCIDAGETSSDVGLEPEPNGGRINMGAYGGTSEASKSPEN